MLVTKTRNEFFNLHARFAQLGNLKGAKFAYAISRIANAIESEKKRVQELGKRPEAFVEFDKEREELCKLMADKDEKGNPKIENGVYVFSDMTEFDKAADELKAKHKEAIAEYDEQIAEVNKFLEEPLEMNFYDIAMAWIPEDITVEQMGIIEPFLVKE